MLEHLNRMLADRYVVERELGRGGMASVWLAHDVRHDRAVALKVLHPELAAAIGVDRFVREIRLTARLQHPHIVPVFDSGVLTGAAGETLPWYAMGCIPGESLRARLDREGQLPVEDALTITEQAADALHAAHREGIVHRDIKPENLLLAGGQAWVADFGIAKALADTGGERLTSTGLVIGTPAYMSPEQATGDRVDARTDQYSLATVLYEMLAGEPPYTGPTTQAIVARRLSGPPRAIVPVRPSVPAAVEAALLRALERVPADRFPDVAAFAAGLRRAAAPAVQRAPRRPASLAVRVLAGGALVVALAAGGWMWAKARTRGAPPPDPELVALYRRGMDGFLRRTPAGAATAIEAFSAAIRRDSAYAPAWAGLSQAYSQAYGRRFVYPGVARDSVIRLAMMAAERALFLDRGSAEAWVAQATVNRHLDPTDLAPAAAAARQAVALDSGHPRAWHVLAVTVADQGDVASGIAAWRRAIAANPGYAEAAAFLSLAHYWRREYDNAARWADSAVALDPTYVLGRSSAGYVAVELGDFTRARAAFDAARRVSGEVEAANMTAGAAFAEARRPDRAAASRLLKQADSLAVAYLPITLHSAVDLAKAHIALGETDTAIALLRSYEPREDLHFQLHLRCEPPYDPLAADPRFTALLRIPRPPPGTGC